MKILIDIGHPAHVHQFKYTINGLKQQGHEVLVTARKKEVSLDLLDLYKIPYTVVGTYSNNNIAKIFQMFVIDLKMFILARKFHPDLLVGGVGNVYVAHVSFLLRKKCILFNDTEHGVLQDALSFPFADSIVTPSCYKKDQGPKQIRYNGYHQLTHLHPNRFTPNPSVLGEIGLSEKDPFIILRFVSWGASHDIGAQGLSLEIKRKAIREFEKYGRVLITSEKPLSEEFEKYRISVSPEKMHDLLYYAMLLYGESSTMASESAVLGTHAIFSDIAGRGYTDEEERLYGLVYNFRLDESSQEQSVEQAVKLLQDPDLRKKGKEKRERLLKDKIDVTAFMIWFIEHYPESVTIMKNNPDIQDKFK
jgi:uncharacterized protein